MTVRLGPTERESALAAMGDGGEFDVLVIGGGVVGAGTAVDAVTRGLDTALVEARDWSSGTSSRSSKLIHGGLRYLEMLDVGLVQEALRERSLLLRHLAPHLVRPVPFIFPLRHLGWERAYVGTGVALYDTLGHVSGRSRGIPYHRHLTRRGALRLVPSLRKDVLAGAIQYWDAKVDDARLTFTLVRTAATYGAAVANRARVVGFLREGERVVGARLRDLERGVDLNVRAKQIVNATGVWTDDTQAMVGERGRIHVRASKGIHLVVPRDRIHSATGLITRTERSVLFVIPWGRHWIIGTTDTDWDLDKAHPAASSRDIDYLLEQVNTILITPLTTADVEGVYAGLRPLLRGETDEATSTLSREHVVAHAVPGLVVVVGGKLTTYRVMAKDAVDAVAHGLDRKVPQSCTEQVALVGADGFQALWNNRHRLAKEAGLHVARIEHLLRRYGSLVPEVLDLVAADPTLAEPVTHADDYLRAEIVYAASHEGVRHLDDVLARRTHISIETFDRGEGCADEVARLVAPVLEWTPQQVERELRHYAMRVAAERESQRMPDDRTADSARLGAPEIVPVD